jgi:hypothetical protein
MPTSLFDTTVPVMIRYLRTLRRLLEKGRAFADEGGIPHATLLEARLIPDMMTLVQQVQRASDTARFVAVRVGGAEAIPMEDNEASFDDLFSRIDRTIDYLEALPATLFDGREDGEIVHPSAKGRKLTGRSYVTEFAIPNFFFHIATAYGLLRHRGVPLGKLDYLGWREE